MAGQGVGGNDALAERGTGGGGQGDGGGRNVGDGVEGAGEQADAERLRSGDDVERVERTEEVEGLEPREEEAADGFGRLVFRHGAELLSFLFLVLREKGLVSRGGFRQAGV